MTKRQLPTQAEIKEILHYNPETGAFRWRVEIPNIGVKPWDLAGSIAPTGYWRIGIKGARQYSHRIAWLYMTGKWPKDQIDHTDGVRSNNTWANLREATRKQNMENIPLRKNNTSGFRGVFWQEQRKKWCAKVRHNKKNIFLGYFDTAEEAGQAAAAKRAKLFTHDTGRGTA